MWLLAWSAITAPHLLYHVVYHYPEQWLLPHAVFMQVAIALKVVQLAVVASWLRPWLPPYTATTTIPRAPLVLGVAGQFLNAMAYYRLGAVGIYYGAEFGVIPWRRCDDFPYGGWFEHPQYVGCAMSVFALLLLVLPANPPARVSALLAWWTALYLFISD